MTGCTDCPRQCRADRTPQRPGRCGVAATAGRFRVARIMVHRFEEPYISGPDGSGAVFFSGCALGCVFCQNDRISRQLAGRDLSQAHLIESIRRLADRGVANINLVTASHYIGSMPDFLSALRRCADADGWTLPPILWNSSAYDAVDGLKRLEGLVDIYLPDFKFHDEALARAIAGAGDYFAVASPAIAEMVRQQPRAEFNGRGLLRQGAAVRHLVLPGQWRDSIRVLDALAQLVPLDTPLSIMSQYTPPQLQETWHERQTSGQPGRSIAPEAAGDTGQPGRPDRWWALAPDLQRSLSRRLTTYEYEKVLDHALTLGFSRILGQDRASADSCYTPDFLMRND